MSVFFAILTPMLNPLIYSEKQEGEKCYEDFVEEDSKAGCSLCLKSDDLYT